MKQAIISIIAVMSLSISAMAQQTTAQNQQATAESKYTQYLTTADFRAKVYDYVANPSGWKFEGSKPCVIDFYATWCGPCRAFAPILEDVAKEYNGKIDVYKVDTGKEQELARVFGIRSIPTILFVPMKGEPAAAQGALPRETLVQVIDMVLFGKQPVAQPTTGAAQSK